MNFCNASVHWVIIKIQKKDNILVRKNIPEIKHSGKFYLVNTMQK